MAVFWMAAMEALPQILPVAETGAVAVAVVQQATELALEPTMAAAVAAVVMVQPNALEAPACLAVTVQRLTPALPALCQVAVVEDRNKPLLLAEMAAPAFASFTSGDHHGLCNR
jgi:hypothetical protein